ncbi:MAG TPA: hypothetical protein VGY96_20550, partial [Streptosporangiaceae bacterium]|nr:hypothetical protein [Streptosporangiaceae bacterium]
MGNQLQRQPSRGGALRAGLGAIAGLLAAGTALGVGQLVAGLTGANGSPVVAVGQLQIDFTPPWLKNFAIREFGSDDKLVLVSGIVVVLAIFSAVIGALATRRLAYGMGGLAVLAAIGLTAAATRPTATAGDLLPTVAATVAAVIVLRLLINLAEAAVAGTPVASEARHRRADLPVVPDLPAGRGVPGGSGGVIRPSAARGDDWVTSPAPGPVDPARRRFLAASVATAGVAGVAGVAGRLLAERASVAGARSAL